MMTYLQIKAERAFLASALVTVWGTVVVAQGIVLVIYPLYRTVIHCFRYQLFSPSAKSQ